MFQYTSLTREKKWQSGPYPGVELLVLHKSEETGGLTMLRKFHAGTTIPAHIHPQANESAYVLSGEGELRLEGETVAFAGGQGLHIPAGIWHAVANTGSEDVAMVFGFPHPDYPPTQRRET